MRWAGAWVIAQDVLPGFSHSLKFSHLVRMSDSTQMSSGEGNAAIKPRQRIEDERESKDS